MDISNSDAITTVATLVAVLSAFYAWRTASEAKKANDIGRLNALLAIRTHYLELMTKKGLVAQQLEGTRGAERAYEAYADLDLKLREVNKAIDEYHEKLSAQKKLTF